MKWYLILCLFALSVSEVSSQSNLSSVDLRKVTGSGPFPFFINAKARANFVFPMYKNFRQQFDKLHGIDGTYLDYGGEISIGSAVKFKGDFLGRNVHGFELGYQYMRSKVHRSDTIGLSVDYRHYCLRYQFRMNLIYPITFQITPGFVMYAKEKLNEYRYFEVDGRDAERKSGLTYKGGFSSGFELGGKLVFLDPAGTDGGYGLMLEAVYQRYFNNFGFNAIIEDRFGLTEYEGEPRQALMFSVGLIIPIAVRG